MIKKPTDEEIFDYLQQYLTEERKERILDILSRRTRHLTVVMEDVYQMHNTSAVMRSCEIFGIQDLYAISERHRLEMDKEIAMGAQKWVDLHSYDDREECLKDLRKKGYQIIATTPHNDSCYLDDFDVTKKSALVFGTERDGISPEIMKEADGFLKIPMRGFTESFNISVSAAIILQALTQKLMDSDVQWQLTEKEIFEKRLDWTKKSTRSVEQILERYLKEYQQEG
ncbi:tRNA (guanosine(18)-2'-O)-methyltransferase [Flavobacteriaceae bacterium UJ101]|nr:tRNA (guanosine(18)-2'-O)-methyltransferase [Flavobacteriaceae bacterium UJ101]